MNGQPPTEAEQLDATRTALAIWHGIVANDASRALEAMQLPQTLRELQYTVTALLGVLQAGLSDDVNERIEVLAQIEMLIDAYAAR